MRIDHVYETGTQRIFSQLSLVALERFGIPKQHVHFDTTSVNLYGDYRGAEDEEAPFKITHGYSKDKRPDLKQFVLSLLCVDGNIPIVGKLKDGNASDKTNQLAKAEEKRRFFCRADAETILRTDKEQQALRGGTTSPPLIPLLT